jgi:hypothetical protein
VGAATTTTPIPPITGTTLRTCVQLSGPLVHELPDPAGIQLNGVARVFNLALTAYRCGLSGELWLWVAEDGEIGH